eukprot:442976-Prorocentrum_minimum.AAC.1
MGSRWDPVLMGSGVENLGSGLRMLNPGLGSGDGIRGWDCEDDSSFYVHVDPRDGQTCSSNYNYWSSSKGLQILTDYRLPTVPLFSHGTIITGFDQPPFRTRSASECPSQHDDNKLDAPPTELDNLDNMAEEQHDVVANDMFQKAYNRAIDAPTVVKPSARSRHDLGHQPAQHPGPMLPLDQGLRPVQGPLRLRHRREEVHRQ